MRDNKMIRILKKIFQKIKKRDNNIEIELERLNKRLIENNNRMIENYFSKIS